MAKPTECRTPAASPEDPIDADVQRYLRQNPAEAARHTVVRLEQGVYEINGKQVDVEWQHAPVDGQSGHLVVVDGPMRQPFDDYLEMNECNVEYDTHTIEKMSALHHVPKERRMTFDDSHKKYTRLEAMKVAKEQASIREKAADYSRDGKKVPDDDLMRMYNKALRQKLRGRARDDSPRGPRAPREAERHEPATSSAAKPLEPVPMPQQALQGAASAPPLFAYMAPRGVSLNGVPSYLPPQAISRSWSGTNMPSSSTAPSTMMGTASSYVAMPTAVAVPAAVGMSGTSPVATVSPAVTVTAVPVGYYR